jgi:hypothetical protein
MRHTKTSNSKNSNTGSLPADNPWAKRSGVDVVKGVYGNNEVKLDN